MKENILYLWFQLAVGVCNRLAGEIFSKFGNITDIYNCDDFSFLGKEKEKYIKRLENKDTAQAFEILKRCEQMGVGMVGYYSELYPKSLRSIKTPPAVLYYIGELRNLNDIPCVGIVGSRNMTDYGKSITEHFAYNLAQSGVCIVSGLAKGIDTAAHRGAIKAGGYTVAVLGNPIGDIYPKENLKAFETLYERGLVLSEMYPGCPRTRADFPNRNRIISGLSDVILVSEAGENSGALITVRHGVEQGKMIFAVPGSIGAENAGTNQLIKTGTPVATDPQDVLAPLLTRYPEMSRVYVPSATAKLRAYGNAKTKIDKEIKNSKSTKNEGIEKPTIAEASPRVEISEEPKVKIKNLKNAVDEIRLSGDVAETILSVLNDDKPMTADEIVTKTGLAVSEVMTELTFMEIDGSVTVSVGGRYSRRESN